MFSDPVRQTPQFKSYKRLAGGEVGGGSYHGVAQPEPDQPHHIDPVYTYTYAQQVMPTHSDTKY